MMNTLDASQYDDTVGIDQETEVAIAIGDGFLVFPSADADPDGCEYVRFVSKEFEELAYWNFREWEEDPISVMGAIMGAVVNLYSGNMESFMLDEKNFLDNLGPGGILEADQGNQNL